MNILVLSAGSRCQLVRYFKQERNGFNKVVATDCSIYAPAVYMSDVHYIVPKIYEIDYLPTLLDICKREKINIILPLLEDELELIASNRELFENRGILVAVSHIEAIKMCRDKYKLYIKLIENGIDCVETYDYETEQDRINDLRLPVLAKERCGAGSIGNLKIGNLALLHSFAENTEKALIVQPYLQVKEYGVDVYVDFISGEVVAIFAKEKLRMRAGETEYSKSYKNTELFELVKKAVKALELKGVVDMDVFKYNGKFHILEINPRFGGGYPHAYECGVNFMYFLAKNAQGEKNIPAIGNYVENEVLLKYADVMLKNEKDMF